MCTSVNSLLESSKHFAASFRPSVCPSQSFMYFLFVVAVIAAAGHETDGSVGSYWYTDRKFTIVVTAVLVILPLSIPKEIGFQKYARYKQSTHSAHFLTEDFRKLLPCMAIASELFFFTAAH